MAISWNRLPNLFGTSKRIPITTSETARDETGLPNPRSMDGDPDQHETSESEDEYDYDVDNFDGDCGPDA